MDIRRARREEVTEVDALLKANSLPPLPMQTSLSNVLIALDQGSVIGAIALEVVARRGLLRPAAVSQAYQDGTAGESLVRSLIARAHELSLRELYLLTDSASEFFAALGFSPVSRAAVPSDVRSGCESWEQCPESAEIMRLDLGSRV